MRHSVLRLRVSILAIALVASAAGLFLLLGGNLPLRFAYAPLNYLAYAAFLLSIPATIFALSLAASMRWLKILGIVMAALAFLPTGLLSLFATLQMAEAAVKGKDLSFEQLAELKGRSTTFRVYRSNGGATTDFGVVLRQERTILPGLKYVRIIHSRYHAKEASLVSSSDGKGRLTIEPYGENQTVETFAFAL
jgi:hypothetical protein